MNHHVPRKLKKKAKKVKAAHDAMVMVQSAMVSAMGLAQVSIVAAQPMSIDMPPPVWIATKAVNVAQVTMDSAKTIKNCMSQIKPWYGHIKNYRPRL